jgi:hypothetical protein
MVTATYEHIVIILLVGVIFVGTVVALPAINYSTFQSVDQQQLKNTALNVLNSMLLGVGAPPTWGSSIPTEVEEFGLAKSSPFSKYVLDTNKVQRLDQDNPWHFTCEQVRDMLKLQGYGFNFTLYRPFIATPLLDIDTVNNKVNFAVTTIRTQDGAPIPNAEVDVTLFMSSVDEVDNIESHANSPYMTDATGYCHDSITIPSGIVSIIAVLQITAGGMSTVVVKQESYINLDEFIRIDTYGDIVRLTLRSDELKKRGIPPAERKITGAWAIKSGEKIDLLADILKITWGAGWEYADILFEGLSELDATALVIRLNVKIPSTGEWADTLPPSIRGRLFPVYICGALNFGATDEILNFGFETPTHNTVATVRRIVVIANMAYIAELGLWKEII